MNAAPRLDLYAAIHKALRLALHDTLARVGRTDVDDADDLQAALADTEALLALMRGHLEHENEFIHPAIEARRPGGAGQIAGEHVEHQQSIAALADDVAALRQAAPAHRALALQRLYRHLALFVAENLQHMNVEETRHNQLLWAHYTDEELHALHERLKASIPPEEMMTIVRWMAAAATPGELAAMLGEMRAQAPAPAFEAVMGVLRRTLPPARLARVDGALALAA